MNTRLSAAGIHAFLYRSGLLMLACALPLSRSFVTIAQGLLVLNWLAERDYKTKISRLKEHPSVLIFASLFLVYLAGLIHSDDTPLALSKIKNFLSVPILALVIGSSTGLPRRFIRVLLLSFAAAVTLASVISLIRLAMAYDPEVSSLVRPTLFMSPIRFSLLVNMAVFILYELAFRDGYGKSSTGEKILYAIFIMALASYLIVLQSMTGLVTFCVLLIWTLISELKRMHSLKARTVSWLVATVCMLVFILYPVMVYRMNFQGREIHDQELDSVTVNGNSYVHETGPGVMENGHYIDIYVCEKELRQAWDNASALPYDGTDRKGQQLSYTLRRYMTSKGLRKDSLGFRDLSPADIENVESGMTNYRFLDASPLFQRLYATLWEVHVYLRTGYVQNHSFSQRIVFTRLSLDLIRKHPFFGTGQGDVQQAMLLEAVKNNTLVEESWEGKPHDQFLFLILAFGLAGFAWALFAWIYPLVSIREKETPMRKAFHNYLRNIFLIIVILSMLVMDTLESYDSIVFFALFYSLFVFGLSHEDKTAQRNFTP